MSKKRLNGSGSIFYREDRKRWVYQIYFEDKKRTISSKSQRDLMKKITEFEQKLYEKQVNKKSLTLIQILEYINDNKYELNKILTTSYIRRKETFKMLDNELLNMQIDKITELMILETYKVLITKYSNSTISKMIILLNEAFDYAVKNNLIAKNIIKEVEKPKSKKKQKKVRGLTIEEQKKLLSVIHKSKYFLIYLIAINTGMRCGEILALQKADINLINDVIIINKTITRDINNRPVLGDNPKTKKGIRKVPILSQELKSELEKHLKQLKENMLFTNKGELINTSTITTEFKRLNKKYNISNYDVSIHMLRHTFATRCIECGVPALVLAKVLGHSDISTTLNTYTDVFEEYQNKSLENVKKLFSEKYKTVK